MREAGLFFHYLIGTIVLWRKIPFMSGGNLAPSGEVRRDPFVLFRLFFRSCVQVDLHLNRSMPLAYLDKTNTLIQSHRARIG